MMVFALLHSTGQFSWLQWSIHWSTVVGLAAFGALYLWRARAANDEQPLSGWRKLSFFASLFVIFAALNGPIHDLSDTYLFSGHMVQHLMLTMAMPPLLLAGIRGWMLRPLLRNRVIGAIARRLTKPIACFVTFNLVIVLWHLPFFYNIAMANHNIHIAGHFLFMAAAVMMWWPLLSPLPELPRLAYPGQMLYCFLMMIPMTVVAVNITMADSILYPHYSSAPRVLPLSPMDDQLLGGLIMWVPGGTIYMIIMTVVFFKWSARGEDDAAAAQVDWEPSPG